MSKYPANRKKQGVFRIILFAIAAALVGLAVCIASCSPTKADKAAEITLTPGITHATPPAPESPPDIGLQDVPGSAAIEPPPDGRDGAPLPGAAQETDAGSAGDTENDAGIDDSVDADMQPDEDGNEEAAQEAATQEPAVEVIVHDDGIQAAIDRIAEKYGAAGVQAAVIQNGAITGTYVFGDAVKGSRPMNSDTKIRVASISKVVLAMTIMRLCELGVLDIDADISDYWGGTVRNPNHSDIPITMRQIMSHTSSIIVYDYGFTAGGGLIRQRFLDGTCFSRSTPGDISSWGYNNYAFAALGVTVEVAANETVNNLAARFLFAPLGIDAAFGSGSINGTDNLAVIYTSGGGVGRSIDAQRGTLGSTYPGENGDQFPGGLTISAYDLAKLVAVLIGNGAYNGVRVLSPESVALMESSQGTTGGFEQCLPLRHRANLYGEEELYYHTGSNYGMYNLISFDPVNGNGVVVLTSGADGSTDVNGIYAICGEISEYIYRNS